MIQVQHQVRVLTTKRQSLKSEIESETVLLLAERNKQLGELAKEKMKPVEYQEKLLVVVEKHISELRELELQLQNRLQVLHKKMVSKKQELERLQQTNSELLESINTLEQFKETNQNESSNLRNEVDKLNSYIPDLKEECAELLVRKTDLEAANEQLTVNFTRNQSEYEQKLHMLRMKQQQVYDDTVQQQTENEAVRKDLAIRLRTCDEQDKVLRIREVKIVQSEEAIQHNAELLNL